MKLRELGSSGLQVAPWAMGGNVFGWTADEATSFKLLDAFVDAGFNLIDTADVYSRWVPGNSGGESEAIIGKWLKKSGKRNQVLIATKVGMEMGPSQKGLSKKRIFEAVEASLKRLSIDRIDLYQSHLDDLQTPVIETLEAYTKLIKQGKIRAIGASQYSPERLEESLKCSRDEGLASYCCLQPLYNLYDRDNFETKLAPICERYKLGVISFYSLAAGFLSGKYRVKEDLNKSVRGSMRIKDAYFNEKGHKIVEALEQVASKHKTTMSSVAIAWVLKNPSITAPIASVTNLEQFSEIRSAIDLRLDVKSLETLFRASAYATP